MTYLLLYPLPSITLATLLWIRAARQEREREDEILRLELLWKSNEEPRV